MPRRDAIGKALETRSDGRCGHSKGLVFILSEMGAAELLNFSQREVGGLFRLLPFP